MVRFENAAIRIGGKTLFEHLSWQLSPGDRVGLVGPNGSGKTTLLRTLAGLHEVEAGSLHLKRSITLGYLPQHGVHHAGRTVFEEARSVFDALLEMKEKQSRLLERLDRLSPDQLEFQQTLENIERIEERFTHLDGYRVDAEVGAVLAGLGFDKSRWDQATDTLSGGWQMRLALAKLLLQSPSLLLLDEPTNHLDLASREWLAEFLAAGRHTVVLVAHDRHFLDVVVNRISEIDQQTLVDYAGGYSSYLVEKEARLEARRAAFQHQQQEIARIETFIERFRYKATKAAQVQSRIKQLEKMERIPPPPGQRRELRLRFPEPPRSGDLVMELRGVRKAYGAHVVFEAVDLSIYRGDKVGLIGANGCGKSTLIKVMAGREPVDSGERRLGHNVSPAYFAQDQASTLVAARTVLEELRSAAPFLDDQHLRSLLGAFLFPGDDVDKLVEVLSGGEKSRLALCKLLTRPSNFLLLDEPTNHLDLASKEVLLRALLDYAGTVVFVSHDRYFLETLATRIIEIEGGEIQTYPGGYKDYLYHKRRVQEGAEQDQTSARRDGSKGSAPGASRRRARSDAAAAYQERKRAARKLARLKERYEALPGVIDEKEQELEGLVDAMNDPQVASDYERLMSLESSRRVLEKEIERLYDEWQEAAERIESQT